MKYYNYILLLVLMSFVSCRYEYRDNDNYNAENNPVSLKQLLTSYDLWYVDIDQTTGVGNIPFVSRAFTMSFDYSGDVWANNNVAGIGTTGNGYGIKIGKFYTQRNSNFVEIDDNIDGGANFEVRQISNNEIELFNASQNVTYLLIGYQMQNFDFDALFYDNIVYFLQDYTYWKKTGQNLINTGAFIEENFMQFYVDNGGHNRFDTSLDNLTVISGIVWDFEGNYQVNNTNSQTIKRLILNYDNSQDERFTLEVINDQNIRLTNIRTNNYFYFEGKQYIQYKHKSRQKSNDLQATKKNYLKKK